MLYNARNGSVRVGDSEMDYVSFGYGSKNLVMLPGLGDGLSTVKGTALVFALMYRRFAKAFTAYVFSRKNRLPEGYSTRDMARDQAQAMALLGIPKADVVGISQGGMIAQYLAIDHPDRVDRLVLASTCASPNETLQEAAGAWIEMAKQGDYRGLMIDTAEKSYSQARLKTYRLLYPFIGRMGKPKSFQRFLIQAASCLRHDACGELGKIACPTLVIGGDRDRIVGASAAPAIAERIAHSELFIYPGLGHAAYEEAKDFNERVLRFLTR